MPACSHLFQPIRIGAMISKNRVLMSAMSINFGVDNHGRVNDQLTAYFVARARGGAGMMLVGGGAVHPTGLELPQLPTLWNDNCIPALSQMVEAVRPYNCKFGVQLMHGGRQSYHDQKVAPSPIPSPAVVKGVPKELTIEEIGEIVRAFGSAALRCKKAGFDFVEIHGAHGYLINQFLSPNSNKRIDAYGGSFENRTRFLLELFADIKAKCGSDFPVGIRMNGEDYISDGWTIDEALKLAGVLQTQGADYLHVSAGVYGSTLLTIPSMYIPHGCFVHLAEAVKKKVDIPVIAVGRIKTPDLADKIIKENKADVVALGRALLADPQWPEKAQNSRFNAIRPCIGCCLGCIHAVLALEPGGCVVNPDVGREFLLQEDQPRVNLREVLVVGAGPAGLAAARKVAELGHHVTVCERTGQIGGAFRLAALPPGRAELGDILSYLVRELERLEVQIRLNTSFSIKLLEELKPDTVILASGSLPDIPIVKGLFKTDMELFGANEVLDGKVITGDRIIVFGGGQVGLVLADTLATQGKTVAVVHRKSHFAEEMSSNDRYSLIERLKKTNVNLFKPAVIETFLKSGVRFRVKERVHSLDGFDTVVIAEAMTPVREAANLIKNGAEELHVIGDAKKPRHLMFAISEAEEVARTL